MKIEITNAEVVLETKITADGRIYGLKKYSGRSAKIVILEE